MVWSNNLTAGKSFAVIQKNAESFQGGGGVQVKPATRQKYSHRFRNTSDVEIFTHKRVFIS
jgi:hypothetical protein